MTRRAQRAGNRREAHVPTRGNAKGAHSRLAALPASARERGGVTALRQSFGRPNRNLMRLLRLWRRLSCLAGRPRDFRPGMQGSLPLSFSASPNHSASWARAASNPVSFGKLPGGADHPRPGRDLDPGGIGGKQRGNGGAGQAADAGSRGGLGPSMPAALPGCGKRSGCHAPVFLLQTRTALGPISRRAKGRDPCRARWCLFVTAMIRRMTGS